jgi:uncharacterized protein (UPF0261 family)
VLVLATVDTKPEETAYLARAIRAWGHQPCVVDLSLRAGAVPAAAPAGISRTDIAGAAGQTLAELAGLPRAQAMEVVAAAAGDLVAAMVGRGEAHAAIGIGGGTGSWLATAVLGRLPHGFPKLVVSTLAGRDAGRDIMVLPSVVDIAGVNRLLAPVLANAAAAACGMADGPGPEAAPDRPVVAVTMFGVTTAGATHLRRFLAEQGCEVVVFHANGTGGATMEQLTRHGAFDAVVDWTTSEITDELVGGICTAGPGRLEAAGEAGLPQLVVPGAVDVINVAGGIPDRFAGRPHHWHLPTVPLIRTSVAESAEIGSWMASKLNAARGPVRVLVPGLGFSALDAPGGVFEDRAADEAWTEALRAGLRGDISVDVVEQHINDEAFARAAADAVLDLIGFPLAPDEAGGQCPAVRRG